MLPVVRKIVLAVVVLVALVSACRTPPAMAQSGTLSAPLIQASFVYNYARYYTPYAIQAAAAYLPIDQLGSMQAKQDQDGYGADVNYTIQNVFSDQTIAPRAREAFKAWQYQFGRDAYLTCIDPTDSDCQAAYLNRGWSIGVGPAFQVWARTRFPHTGRDVCTEVSIAFRGTSAGLSDWISNAHQIAGLVADDEYHQLKRNIDGIISLIKSLDCYKRARLKPRIVSLGHSLGGGLAQLAALANKPTGPRIVKVFAFDPSPVTGADLVETGVRTVNATG